MGEATREDRIAALRALRYSDVSIGISGDWVEIGGDVYRHVDGSTHGCVEENNVAKALASARAAGKRELVEAFRSCEHGIVDSLRGDVGGIQLCRQCGARRDQCWDYDKGAVLVWSGWDLPGLLDGEAGR